MYDERKVSKAATGAPKADSDSVWGQCTQPSVADHCGTAIIGIYTCAYPFCYLGAVFGVAGGLLLFRSFAGRYVLVEGVCQQIEQTAIRKKTKSIYFTTEPYVVKVRLRHRLKEIAVGDHIAVFVSDNMPVYQENGCQILNGYIAIEIKKGSGIHD